MTWANLYPRVYYGLGQFIPPQPKLYPHDINQDISSVERILVLRGMVWPRLFYTSGHSLTVGTVSGRHDFIFTMNTESNWKLCYSCILVSIVDRWFYFHIVSYLRICEALLRESESLSEWQPRGNRSVFRQREEEGGSLIRILLCIAEWGHST